MKKFLVCILLVCLLAMSTGCSMIASFLNGLSELSGGSYETQTYNYTMADTVITSYFDFKINSAKQVYEIESYVPDDVTHRYLVINITVVNTYKDYGEIMMYYDDFELTWEKLEDAVIYAEAKFANDQLPDEYEIFKGESRTGNVIFEIPKGVTDFKFQYRDYWGIEADEELHIIDFTADELGV